MNTSAPIADSLLRRACTRSRGAQAGGLTAQSLNVLSSTPQSFAVPHARLASRLRDFATNRHE